MEQTNINPALGLHLPAINTLSQPERSNYTVSVVIPAHNEEDTIEQAVTSARDGLAHLGTQGEIIVAASACEDRTADRAEGAGADVLLAPIGKGSAVRSGIQSASGDIICLLDADFEYFGKTPIVAELVEPILMGVSDATISDLYWRPLYPQMWLFGFFAPVAGWLFPELLPKCGSTPWSGQRAAKAELWPDPDTLPDGFTVDLAILLHWNESAPRLRPIISDDWVNPQRPKPHLMAEELDLLCETAVRLGRIDRRDTHLLKQWYAEIHEILATYDPDRDEPGDFERMILNESRARLPLQTRHTN
ncbi:glycosyltransferase [Actinoalloteichus caeruleus]|uniref:glycosyltransferase n=1 Tax=Actinoalloteichus cyanogriseus TaxID=2893586 RepID=UPI003BB9148D